jgi:hypothetical protein
MMRVCYLYAISEVIHLSNAYTTLKNLFIIGQTIFRIKVYYSLSIVVTTYFV